MVTILKLGNDWLMLHYTKEQKRNENGIWTFRFSFFLLYKDLDFCQFKVFYTKSGAKWLNFKTNF